MKPSIISKDELIAALRIILEAIENDDSMEGRIRWTAVGDFHEPDSIPANHFEVDAFWRMGNQDGSQGGSIMILDPDD